MSALARASSSLSRSRPRTSTTGRTISRSSWKLKAETWTCEYLFFFGGGGVGFLMEAREERGFTDRSARWAKKSVSLVTRLALLHRFHHLSCAHFCSSVKNEACFVLMAALLHLKRRSCTSLKREGALILRCLRERFFRRKKNPSASEVLAALFEIAVAKILLAALAASCGVELSLSFFSLSPMRWITHCATPSANMPRRARA